MLTFCCLADKQWDLCIYTTSVFIFIYVSHLLFLKHYNFDHVLVDVSTVYKPSLLNEADIVSGNSLSLCPCKNWRASGEKLMQRNMKMCHCHCSKQSDFENLKNYTKTSRRFLLFIVCLHDSQQLTSLCSAAINFCRWCLYSSVDKPHCQCHSLWVMWQWTTTEACRFVLA